jgi:hypothetical protein
MGRRCRTTGVPRARAKTPELALVRRARKPRARAAETDAALDARIERAARRMYELYDDLSYFIGSPEGHRERLRSRLSWPDVGHVTSLARALAEEDRFTEWARFNGYAKVA